MTQQQTTDADLIEIAVKAIRQGYKDGKLKTWSQEMAAVIAAVQPIIAAQAKAEGRREALQEVLETAKTRYWEWRVEDYLRNALAALDTETADGNDD